MRATWAPHSALMGSFVEAVFSRPPFFQVGKAQKESQRALDEAKKAFERAQTAKNQSEDVSSDLQDLLDRIDKFLNEAGARPAEIRVLAEEVRLSFFVLEAANTFFDLDSLSYTAMH